VKSERLKAEEKELLQQKIQAKENRVEVELVEFQRAEICISRLCEGLAQKFVRICTTAIQGVREREVEQIGVLVGQIFQRGQVTGSIAVQNSVFLCGPNNNKIN
jgi:hypothetical protein